MNQVRILFKNGKWLETTFNPGNHDVMAVMEKIRDGEPVFGKNFYVDTDEVVFFEIVKEDNDG